MEKIISLAKRRGFIFPSSEIYGGLANSYDYGPLGVELKNNIKNLWWERFVHRRDDIVGLDSTLIMNPKVWEASGHLKEFSDPLVECKKCHTRFREDENDTLKCPNCGGEDFSEAKQFNLMFKSFMGPAEESANIVYFRPETAQGMFVDFKNVLDSTRVSLPFGIAQIGRAFRNEITPGNFIFRLREFEMMEIEYFVQEKEWERWFEEWRKEMLAWIKDLGIDLQKVHEHEISESDRAHYSKRTIDFEYDFPFGQKELYGLAYRTDFDLKNHEKFSGENLKYRDPETNEEFWPHVIEPTWGVDRTVLAVLAEAYDDSDPERIVLRLKPELAPYKVAVFPLLANKPELVDLARQIYNESRSRYMTAWDDRGNIGKRYYAQDEIGTPYCVTVDFQSLEDQTVTVRDRDSMNQERVKIEELADYLKGKL
ncbi:MAG: glycine--tRNA ligase [Candidatus Colwellbacteria bacterium]|nr:glycine--tRNA ligase [Candidatus Colwellbacteria bacterium]